MQLCVVQLRIKDTGREPGWCRANPEHHEPHAPFLIPSKGSVATYAYTVFVSNLCYLIKLVLSTHLCYFINLCRLIKLLSSYRTFVIFSPLVIYSLFTLSTHPTNAPAVHITNTTLSCLVVRTLSVPIYLSNSPGVFGYRAILIWGDRDMAGGFLEEQPVTFSSK